MLALIFALSIDGLLVGIDYSLKKIRLPLAAFLTVGLITSGLMGIAVFCGRLGGALLTASQGELLGGYLLLGIGLWQLAQGWQQKLAGAPTDQVASFRIKPLGLVIEILRDPELADLNCSGTIDLKEALLLGCALGMDTLGAGFAAALAQLSLWSIPLAGLCAMGMLLAGDLLGKKLKRFANWLWPAPGVIIICLALMQL